MRAALLAGLGIVCAILLSWQVAAPWFQSQPFDEASPAYVQQKPAGDDMITLQVASAVSGPNVILVQVKGQDGRPATDVDRVTLFPQMPGHDMSLAAAAVATERTGAGEFRADTAALEMFGSWDIAVAAATPQKETSATFQVQLAPSRPQIAVFAGVPLTLLAIALALLVVIWRRSPRTPAIGPNGLQSL